ncbi:hypothetical protein PBI_NABY_1 [Microbacterium phage Naby]|uniref:Uncharacterized protein n=1 Tax=Microbacterium phage BonaeVitae TaxID=2126925 RepID=A0A2R3ZZI3_9CAUD|nr:hypothetical protein JTF59_gp01 [Microbacterium phage BonaeVitae]AVR56151.1 hypothetical protein SEA_BONAEVITAE_1 [Microbacterium phage BonaeVitae]QFG10643.1 hypothetical protein PBI_NABY_1 [Microbacterium phage Naby]
MTEQSAADPAEPFELPANSSWLDAVELFQTEAAAWLSAGDAPQLMALRSIARELDTGKFQAALISQFTLIHRALLNRRPGEPQQPVDPDASRRAALGPSLFEQLGGAWTADA